MFSDLKDKVVVVTGGVTGIGGAASLAFADAGATVLAQYLGGGPELETLKARGIATLKLDLTAVGAPQKLIDEAMQRFGRIDVLVNNAGSLVASAPSSAVLSAAASPARKRTALTFKLAGRCCGTPNRRSV